MNSSTLGRGLLIASGVVIVATVVAAIAVIGSPAAQRDSKLDARRIEDLVSIAQAVDQYAEDEGALPPDLDTLERRSRLALAARDPEGKPYRYQPLGEREFRLCATFVTDSRDLVRRAEPWANQEWRHPAGEHCFERKLPQQ